MPHSFPTRRSANLTRRALGVLILLDTSSSVKDLAPDGQTIQQQQIALGWELASTLDAAGDRVALYGFNSWGRERVHMLRMKGRSEERRVGKECVTTCRYRWSP